MSHKRMIYALAIIGVLVAAYVIVNLVQAQKNPATPTTKTEEQWRKELTPEQYRIMRQAGTEAPFSHPLNDEKRVGTFYDATGTQALFRSEDKFDSGTGWPSFTKPIDPEAVIEKTDYKLGYPRTEILSSQDGHHLGHVFPDGPEPTGLRYCINGAALKFVADEE